LADPPGGGWTGGRGKRERGETSEVEQGKKVWQEGAISFVGGGGGIRFIQQGKKKGRGPRSGEGFAPGGILGDEGELKNWERSVVADDKRKGKRIKGKKKENR